MGAVATFVLSDGQAEILDAGNLPAGVISQAEPVLLSRKLWDDDRVIMMTDGVLEACPGLEKEQQPERVSGVHADEDPAGHGRADFAVCLSERRHE